VPHVVLRGKVTVDSYAKIFEPFVVREGESIVKVNRLYRELSGRTALLETLVVDRGHTQKFFIQLAAKEEGLTVRLDPLTDPEKTPGVRRALATVAHRIHLAFGCPYGNTNIEDHLIR
jgi:hypothetical protein